jgi:superfamily I DNA and/or RNA helicase
MNLYKNNLDIHPKTLEVAEMDLKSYSEFLKTAISTLEKNDVEIKLKRVVVKIQEKNSNDEEVVKDEIRYTPEDEKINATKILFNESTRKLSYKSEKTKKEDFVFIIDRNENENYVILNKDVKVADFKIKQDAHQLRVQRTAVDTLRNTPLSDHLPLLNLYSSNKNIFNRNYLNYEIDNWFILKDLNSQGTIKQRSFVTKAYNSPDFALMEGPPGSGKTTTIIELIIQLILDGKRVLLCSATHAAIDNVFERIKGKYKEVCDDFIVPIRISRDEKAVSEKVRPYLLQNVVKKYKDEIVKFLVLNQELESQKYLLDNINNEYDTNVEKLILNSANLVAGTMVGILQHPDIKNNKNQANFDVLIVDEASKVTFTDFLVPALQAKKWILVGDIKQLSPYVEDDFIAESISNLATINEQEYSTSRFELWKKLNDDRYKGFLKVIFINEKFAKRTKQWLDERNLISVLIDNNWPVTGIDIREINACDVAVVTLFNGINIPSFLQNINVPCVLFNTKESLDFKYKQRFLKNKWQLSFNAKDDKWANMVADRISQSFSFRDVKGFEHIENELDFLLPENSMDVINKIKRLHFPSILEMLQNGAGKRESYDKDNTINKGFKGEARESRFEALKYQHRMQPDIALTSIKHFYDNDLVSANTIKNREWLYKTNEPDVLWFPNTSGNSSNKIVNKDEVIDIKERLTDFLQWAESNPKAKGNYEVAILSFYSDQVAELRKMLRGLCKDNKAFAKFNMNNVEINLYTVDKFQGQEADVVFLSFAKASPNAFYNNPNRLNVALTRARFKLYLFGNKEWLKRNAKLEALRFLANKFTPTLKYK